MATKLVDGEGTRQSWQEGGRGRADTPSGQVEGEERTGEAKEGPAAKFAAVSVLLGRRRQRIRGAGEKVYQGYAYVPEGNYVTSTHRV